MIDSLNGIRGFMGLCPPGTASPSGKCEAREKPPTDGESTKGPNRPASAQSSEEKQRETDRLKKQDREVRNHEAAHVGAGGHYVRGGASFSYVTGPDGKRYASGGEVSIDTSPVRGDPEATVRKMQAVRRAALAPANPSGQDRAVAAKASQQEAAARRESAPESNQDNKSIPSESQSPSSHEAAAKRYAQASSYREIQQSKWESGREPINLIG